MTYYSKTVAIGKKLQTKNCGPHNVQWFIVNTLSLISTSNTGMIRTWVCGVISVSKRSISYPSVSSHMNFEVVCSVCMGRQFYNLLWNKSMR